MAIDDSDAALPAVKALALAERARAAAEAPQPTPRWYGPGFALAFSVYGIAVGQALGAGWGWLAAVFAGVFAVFSGGAAAVAVRSGGVARRWAPELGPHVLSAVLQVLAAGALAAGAAWTAGGDVRWTAGAAGTAAGVAFWRACGMLNARVRRGREGAA
ncbi:hypothetical protein [Streptomyces roseolilacinus]|uniref:hypothetical protein n=1 Tax=Streptomyces roseolilacinus TaxID=66904 RepID=UPI00382E0DE9